MIVNVKSQIAEGSCWDVKMGETALISKRRLDSYIDHNSDSIMIIDQKGNIQRVNNTFEKTFGFKREEVENQTSSECPIIPQTYKEEVELLCKHAQNGMSISGFETKRMTKSGTILDIHMSLTPFLNRDNEVESWIVIYRDITEQKQNQKELEATKAELETFVENNVDAIMFVDQNGSLLKINKAFETIFGWKYDELKDIPLMNQPFISRKELRKIYSILKELTNGERVSGLETKGITKSGDLLPFLVSITNISEKKRYAVILKDISILKSTQELLHRSETLSLVGQLAAGVAHEIKNPLTSLKGFTQLLKSSCSEKELEYFEIMEEEFNRIELIVNEMMVLAKPQTLKVCQNDLAGIIDHVLALLNTEAIMKNIEIVKDILDIPSIECDQNQIKQVFVNVIKNAIDSMSSSGKIVVRAKEVPSGHVEIEIIDEGEGIPEHVLPKLTQPFYTTKNKGTGLGLMMTSNIINKHNGTLQFNSREGEGTVVTITLPITQE